MTIVRFEHMRALGYCSAGGRAFFERHGLDWSQFLAHGINAQELEATGDTMARRVVEEARNSGR